MRLRVRVLRARDLFSAQPAAATTRKESARKTLKKPAAAAAAAAAAETGDADASGEPSEPPLPVPSVRASLAPWSVRRGLGAAGAATVQSEVAAPQAPLQSAIAETAAAPELDLSWEVEVAEADRWALIDLAASQTLRVGIDEIESKKGNAVPLGTAAFSIREMLQSGATRVETWLPLSLSDAARAAVAERKQPPPPPHVLVSAELDAPLLSAEEREGLLELALRLDALAPVPESWRAPAAVAAADAASLLVELPFCAETRASVASEKRALVSEGDALRLDCACSVVLSPAAAAALRAQLERGEGLTVRVRATREPEKAKDKAAAAAVRFAHAGVGVAQLQPLLLPGAVAAEATAPLRADGGEGEDVFARVGAAVRLRVDLSRPLVPVRAPPPVSEAVAATRALLQPGEGKEAEAEEKEEKKRGTLAEAEAAMAAFLAVVREVASAKPQLAQAGDDAALLAAMEQEGVFSKLRGAAVAAALSVARAELREEDCDARLGARKNALIIAADGVLRRVLASEQQSAAALEAHAGGADAELARRVELARHASLFGDAALAARHLLSGLAASSASAASPQLRARAWYDLACVKLALSASAEALECLRRAQQQPSGECAEAAVAEAMLLLDRGDFESSGALVRRAVAAQPRSLLVRSAAALWSACAEEDEGMELEMREVAALSAATWPEASAAERDQRVRMALATALSTWRLYRLAELALLATLAPPSPLDAAGRPRPLPIAGPAVRSAEELSPELRTALSRVLVSCGRLEEAHALLARAEAREALAVEGLAFFQEGNDEDAIECLEQMREGEEEKEEDEAAQVKSAREPEALITLAHLYENAGRFQQAEAVYTALAASEATRSSAALAGLGFCQWQRGRSDEAEATLARASALDPDNPRVWAVLALLARASQRPEEATAFAERALACGVAESDAHLHRALTEAQ